MISRTFFGDCRNKLRNRLADFLVSQKNEVTQPLLSSEEIIDLQLRVNSRNIQPAHLFDTAEQRMGDKQSIHRGYGLDYEESRVYQAGDEPRYMNWKLTARTGELYMKIFREERRPGVFILLDRRKSMIFGTRTRLKVTQAARVTTCITFSAQQHHSSIGAIVLENDKNSSNLIKEENDAQAASELIRVACAPCSPVINQDKNMDRTEQKECEYERALNILQQTLIPGSQIYLIGDFIDLGEQHRSTLMQLSERNNVCAIHIFDPSEKTLPKMGALRFHTTNNNQEITIDTADSTINKAYKNAATDHFVKIKNMFNALNITYKDISTVCEPIETELANLQIQ